MPRSGNDGEPKRPSHPGPEIDPQRFAAERDGQEISLTLKEFRLLETLASYPDRIFTKEQLHRTVWEDEWLKDENVINVTISRLREK